MPRCHDFASFCRQLPRLKSCSLRLLHFPPILKETFLLFKLLINTLNSYLTEVQKCIEYRGSIKAVWSDSFWVFFHNCPRDICSMSIIYFSLRWLLQSNCLACLLFIIRTPPFWNITVFWFNTTQIVISHMGAVFSRREVSMPI
jgi:hypothetical protein